MLFCGLGELVKFHVREAFDPKRESAAQELAKAGGGCSLLAINPLEKPTVGEQRRSFVAAVYAASFVTRECAASLACALTIFISCQS